MEMMMDDLGRCRRRIVAVENMLFVRENTNISVPRIFALYLNPESGKGFIVMEPSEKKGISSALQRYFNELRQLPSPKYFGSFGKRHLLDEIFWTCLRAKYFYNCFPLIFKGHKATFTHGDLQRKNIIIRDEGRPGNQDPHIVIIAWGKAGWDPAYWEYFMAVWALRWDDGWCLWVDSVLTPFVSEAAWFQSQRLELWS
ncbi:hypothetical protein BDV28DRAFT_160236 [Aspergillus coremiiformis]|uniref:Aminoglycoside phosphotransferase domain-containing protein n=1 Tax=Aspergillus coremiiformis TaxID=138285 RepID=A0A5N6YWB2_9EURO|nr:hypothetical protein BDV28DRAFT_160236 [Aspergillus coremiiformis]